MSEISKDQRLLLEGLVAAKFLQAFESGEQFAAELSLLSADEDLSRSEIARRYPQFARQFEQLTQQEVIASANTWPIAAALASAAV